MVVTEVKSKSKSDFGMGGYTTSGGKKIKYKKKRGRPAKKSLINSHDALKNLLDGFEYHKVDNTSSPDKLDAIVKERESDYGDFKTNMIAATRVLESMLSQADQRMRFSLPDSFAARFMAQMKMLRQCHKHKQDNIDDRKNYDMIADELDILDASW